MKILGDPIIDNRIECKNYMIEMTLQEYYDITQNILKNNEYQRRRVKSSSTIYSLLKDDLRQGCTIPPIVLALKINIGNGIDVLDVITKSKDEIIILDGLQRSYTIRDLLKEISGSPKESDVQNHIIRIELYTGINKFGILYRMLTYNTGQTQMSTRHQIEIIYSDYIDKEKKGVKYLREVDDETPRKLGEYRFRDIVDGFTSYLERDYLSLERVDILNSIKSLQELTKEDPRAEIFDVFVDFYHGMVKKLNEQAGDWTPDKKELEVERVFATNVVSIFNKSQSLTGFGAAVGRLIDKKIAENIVALMTEVEQNIFDEVKSGLDLLIIKMEDVRNNAKKIGNDQRLFFFHFYRGLLSKGNDSYMNIKLAVEYAYNQYERETM